jgi:hypothetical protein
MIIQIALQIAQTQGQAVTGQFIFQIANQITNNPNGIYTQLLLQLLKQDNDDNGKSSHTVKIIKTVIRSDGDDHRNNNGGREGDRNKKLDSTPAGYHWKKYEITTSLGKKITVDELNTPSGGKVIFYPDKTTKVIPPSNSNDKRLQAFKKELQEAPKKYNDFKQNPPPSGTGNPPPIQLGGIGNTRISTGPIHLCFICASGNDIDYQRVNNIATGAAQLTGVSTEAAELAVSDTYLRTANEGGPAQASQALASFEGDAASNPNSLNKIGDVAKLYDSGHEDVAYQVSNSIADKLSTGADIRTALEGTSVPDAASLKATGETTTEGAADPNLIQNPQEDPNLFQITSSTEQEQADKTTPPATDDGTTPDDGTTGEDGATAFAGGTTTTDTDTDEGGGDTTLDTDDEDNTGDGDTNTGDSSVDDGGGDTSSDGDSSDSSSSDSGDSGDSSDSSGDSGDSGGGGDSGG